MISNDRFKNRDQLRVVVADPSSSIRMELIAVLKELGITPVDSVSGVADLRKVQRSQTLDWVICPLFSNDSENTAQVLKSTAASLSLHKPVFSFLLEQEEDPCVPLLFELGAVSFHRKNINRENLTKEFDTFLTRMNDWKHKLSLLAGTYLHSYLIDKGESKNLVEYYDRIIRLFKDEPRLLIMQAEAKFSAKMGHEALNALRQAMSIDPTLEEKANTVRDKYIGKIEKPPVEMSLLGSTGLDSCLVVDPDADIQRAMETILQEFGVKTIVFCSNGLEAWQKLESGLRPKLFVTEWKIPALSGPKLIQRIRADAMASMPIVVISSLLKKDDFVLLQEMGVAALIQKPIKKKDFLLNVNWALLQSAFPFEQASMEQKMLALLTEGNKTEAKAIKEKFIATPAFSESRKKYVEAEWLYHNGQFSDAKEAVVESMRLASHDTISTSGLLGKILMKLGDPESALKFFEKACSLSPQNLDRLCQLAEASVSVRDYAKANDAIGKAEAIDATNSKVLDTSAKVATAVGDTEKAKKILNQTGKISPVVSFMNTQAIAAVRAGQFDLGMKLYDNTAKSIPSQFGDVIASVKYNSALANARFNKVGEAEKVLLEIAGQLPSDHRLTSKVKSLGRKVEVARKTGKAVQLSALPDMSQQSQAAASAAEEDDWDEFVSLGPESTNSAAPKSGPTPSEMYCLKDIFQNIEPLSDFAKNLLK